MTKEEKARKIYKDIEQRFLKAITCPEVRLHVAQTVVNSCCCFVELSVMMELIKESFEEQVQICKEMLLFERHSNEDRDRIKIQIDVYESFIKFSDKFSRLVSENS